MSAVRPPNQTPDLEQEDPGSYLDERLHSARLANGMELQVLHREHAPLAACRLFIAAGSRFDHGRSGRAHLTEHCLASAARLGRQPVERALESLGAELEASTHREFIHFGVSALAEDLPRGLEALARICIDSPVDGALVERERAIIVHELQQYRDSLDALWDVLFAALWQDHPLLPPPIGGPDLPLLGPDDVREHRRLTVRPERAALAVVSAVDPERVIAEVERCFAGWQAGDGEPPAQEHPRRRRPPERYRMRAELQRAYFLLGWPVPAVGSQHDAELRVLANLLAGGASSRLVRRLRDEDTAVYDVQAVLAQFSDVGVLAVTGSCAPDRLDEVLARATRIVGGDGGAFDPRAVPSARASCCGELLRHYETARRRAGLLGRSRLWRGPRLLGDRVSAVRQVTAERLAACSHRLLQGVEPAVAVLG